jgi:hypothetical protein
MEKIAMVNHECRHIKTNGLKCRSKALKGMPYCYYHNNVHRQSAARPRSAKDSLSIPFPEDKPGILLALDQVFYGITSKKLNTKEAGLLLYGLQIASNNVERRPVLLVEDPVESVSVTPAGHELGPEKRPCSTAESCTVCPDRLACIDYDVNEVAKSGFAKIKPAPPAVQPEQVQQVGSHNPANVRRRRAIERRDRAARKRQQAAERRKPSAGEKKPPAKAEPDRTHPETGTLPTVQAVASSYPAPSKAPFKYSRSALRAARAPRRRRVSIQAAEKLHRAAGRRFISGKTATESARALAPDVCPLEASQPARPPFGSHRRQQPIQRKTGGPPRARLNAESCESEIKSRSAP